MKEYFGISFEFSCNSVNQIVINAIENQTKGYVCVVDGNVLANSKKDSTYREIINNALVNTCDGSSIAKLAGIIHKQKFRTYTGPEIFSYFVRRNYKQLFLGNTIEVFSKLETKLQADGLKTDLMRFVPLPFLKAEDFDYNAIATNINSFSPDIIWVSLGAPKQEIFISKLLLLIDRGIMFAIGAAINHYINDPQHKRAPQWILKIQMEWLYRSIKEPGRIGRRALQYARIIPGLMINEMKKAKSNTY